MEIDHELSETTEPRPRMSCLKGLGWLVLMLALLAALGVFWHRGQTASKLQQTLAEMDRTEPGWRLEDIEAARDDMPEEDNSARVVVAAAEQLPRPWPSKELVEEHFHALPPNEMLNGDDFIRLSMELASARAALDVAAKLADMPHGRHRIYYERNPIATLLADQQESRRIVALLVYESMRRNQKGESKKALTACRAALNAARSIGDEPIFVSQLIRLACVFLACQAVERTLGQGEPPPEDMSALQKLLEIEDTFPVLLAATRGERALFHKAFEGVECGELSVDDLDGLPRGGARTDWLQSTVLDLWRLDTRADHALYLSLMSRRIKEAQRPMHEQAALEKQFDREVRMLPRNAFITRSLLPAVSKMGEAFRRKQALLRCAIVALAAERCRRDKKAWPDNVEQLCPQYLAVVPLDPFDGKPLRYRHLKDGVVIYSVAQDGVDNGGNLDRERYGTSSGTDIGFRLWDANKRRQPPKPNPRNEQKPQ